MATNMKRVRISVPEDDLDVLTWIDNQQSVSLSMRELIRAAVAQYGSNDFFSTGRTKAAYVPRETVKEVVPVVEKVEAVKTKPVVEEVVEKSAVQATPVAQSVAGESAKEKILRMQGLLNG